MISQSHVGELAKAILGVELPMRVLKSNAGFYIGTHDEEGPVSRESVEYFRSKESAQAALDQKSWTQKTHA